MAFLPADYKVPESKGGDYMKFQQGENKFRILSEPVLGFEGWTKDKKCIRKKMDEKWDDIMPLLQVKDGKIVEPKHFWAMYVWNYASESIQLLSITQKTIMSSIEALSVDDDWGDPKEYDIKVIKSGEKLDTEYVVNPTPHKKVDEAIVAEYLKHDKSLEDLFSSPRESKEVDHTVLD